MNNDDVIDMTEFDNFMMPIMEMRRNQKTDQVFEPHDKEKAFIFWRIAGCRISTYLWSYFRIVSRITSIHSKYTITYGQ